MFKRVGANVLFVADLDACMKFYRDVIGLEVVFTDENSVAYHMDGQDFLLLKTPAAVGMLGDSAVASEYRSGQHGMFCVDVEDVDAVYSTLSERGVAFIHPPADQSWGIRAAYFADPEGHLWEIRRRQPSP